MLLIFSTTTGIETEKYDLYLGKITHKEKQLEISNRDSNFWNHVPQNIGDYVLRIKKK